jgi:DNA-binding transcriptional MerR regulator
MNQWYAKDISKLTRVSVRTLHHYDKIGLLTPKTRLANGYRVYSEADLLKLQQIIALKFFGFELAQIRKLLVNPVDMIEHFSMQSRFLREKAHKLQEASMILQNITADCGANKSISWQSIIELIEVYTMAEQIERCWVKEVLTHQ